MHGWRDFLPHLFTITIGLLIALSLEGLVEWQHHRHLVRDAESSHAEVKSNAAGMADTIASLKKEQKNLKDDIVVLNYIVKNHKAPEHSSMTVDFRIRTFDDVGWRTAQSTGALAYMPYDRAEEFSSIYGSQDELKAAEEQGARDAIVSLGSLMNSTDNDDPTGGHAADMEQKIEVLQGQLLLVSSFMSGLDGQYKKFLGEYPN